MIQRVLLSLVWGFSAVVSGQAFVLTPRATAGAGARLSTMSSLREGSFVSQLPSTTIAQAGVDSRPRTARGALYMGKISKFGIFSPAVVAAKVALGETRLNKIRGKAIALHSQVITEYCKWVGASGKLRGLLIRKAKKNGDDLGFLW